jgi:hypothetical protein
MFTLLSHIDITYPPKVTNEWSYTSAHPTCLHRVDMDDFTFTLTSPYYYRREMGNIMNFYWNRRMFNFTTDSL